MQTIVSIYGIPDSSDNNYPSLVHDHNLCVSIDGKPTVYLQTERLTRNKYDSSLPKLLENVLRQLKLLSDSNVSYIFVDNELGRAFITNQGSFRFEGPLNKELTTDIESGNLFSFGSKSDAFVINHELAHIFSTVPFYNHFKEGSLLVHFDGGASKSNFSAWTYKNNKITLIEAHYKYKWLSSLFNSNALVFSIVQEKKQNQNAVPGKFMGLEAYGAYKSELDHWLRHNNFFEDCWKNKKRFFSAAKSDFNVDLQHVDNKNPFIQDMAATIHEIFLQESLSVFRRLQEQTKTDFLYYSGGTALNIKLNTRLLNSDLFKEIYIPPCCNDSGLSLGAATAYAFSMKKSIPQLSPYLNNFGLSPTEVIFSGDDIQKAAEFILQNKVIATCNGAGEVGPRALGNRSILARADRKGLAKKISLDIKKREWYRPVAPVMLSKYFEYFTGVKNWPSISKYMLAEFRIENHHNEILGCIHADQTARIQILHKRNENPFLFDLLTVLSEQYGIKALINTSFNRQGDPIVHTPEQAINSAKEMNLDGLVLNGKFINMNESGC